MQQSESSPYKSLVFLLLIVFDFSCSPGGDGTTPPPAVTKGKMEFKLTDDPGRYAYFRIDIAGLEYNESDNPAIATGWVNIPLQNPGVIDIIQYSNGRELPLGNLELLPMTVKQLRLKLGTQNSFGIYTFPFIGTVSFFDMTLHPSIVNGLVIPFRIDVQPGATNRIYFDFDASHSLVQTGSTSWQLLPAVRVFEAGAISAIDGRVLPAEARPYVRVIYTQHSTQLDHFDTAYGYPDITGYFKIIGLSPGKAIPDSVGGIQKIEFIPRLFPPQPYQPQEKEVQLIKNTIVNTGTTVLTQ